MLRSPMQRQKLSPLAAAHERQQYYKTPRLFRFLQRLMAGSSAEKIAVYSQYLGSSFTKYLRDIRLFASDLPYTHGT